MSKLKLKFVFIFLLFIALLAQATTAQERTAENPLAFLKQLVGEKCAVHLKNGEVINGTLWVYGNDYVSVKVKKGLLYSKTEKYNASEIDFLKDKAANRYYMPRADRETNEKPPTKLYINPDQSHEKENSKPEQEFQGTFRFLSKEKDKKESYTAPPSFPKVTYKKTKPPVAKKTKTVLNNKTEMPRTVLSYKTEEPKTTAPNLYSARPKTIKKEVRKPAKPTYFTKRTPAKKQTIPETKTELPKGHEKQPQEKEVKIAAAENNSQKATTFWNQKYVLLGSGALIIAALFFFKIARVRYRKKTLFPTQVIEIQGKYAVIDHGKTDGIKTDDFIRLYKKTGRQIRYKGKIKVKKVGENYSAVELMKLQPGQELEVSDVGFRDRNLLASAIKQFRIIVSASLRGLAKGLQFTARNIDVKSDEPSVDLRPSRERQNKDVRTVVPQNQRVVKITPGPVTTVQSSFTSKACDFDEEI